MIKQALTGFQYLDTIQYETNAATEKLILMLLNFQDLNNTKMFFNCLLSAYTHASSLKQHMGFLITRYITHLEIKLQPNQQNAVIFWSFFSPLRIEL